MPAPLVITGFETFDLRFPTSLELDGSDAMNPDPDYSAAYVILTTNAHEAEGNGGLCGHGMTFTIGRGNEVCAAAIEAFRPLVVGRSLEAIEADDLDAATERIKLESDAEY